MTERGPLTSITWEITQTVSSKGWYKDPWLYIGLVGLVLLLWYWSANPVPEQTFKPIPEEHRVSFRLEA